MWLLAVGTFAVGTDAFVVTGILPLLADYFGVSVAAAGMLVSVYSFSYGLGTPVLAAVVARWQRPNVVFYTLCGFAVVNLACAFAPTYGVLIVLKAAAGLCAAIYTPTAYLLAASMASEKRRGSALAAVAIGLTLASVFGIPIGTWIGYHFGWHTTFAAIALTTLTAAAAIRLGRLRDPSIGVSATPGLARRIAPLGRRDVWLALAPCLLMYIGNSQVFTYVALLLETRYSADQLPWLLAIYGLGGLAGSPLGGRLADLLGPVKPQFMGLVLLMLVHFSLPFALGTTWTTCVALFLATMSNWACFAAYQARIMRIEPDNASVLIALVNTGVYMGNAIGAAIGALWLKAIPVTALPYSAAATILVALLVLIVSLRRPAPATA
ncbi:MAG TPA: MFS transporter [Stellaceae bacterium]|nr:MFS transporter [Stellaceae bacterium]